MREITINVKLNIREDLDEQDILDQFSTIAIKYFGMTGMHEFIDAELQEPESPGRITGINITDIIDDLVKVYTNLGEDAEDATGKASCDGAVKVLGAFKDLLERHNLDALVPAAELDQISGENLMLSMRLTKAEELLLQTRKYISPAQVSQEDWNLYDNIGSFCYSTITDKPNISAAEVTYNPQPEHGIAGKVWKECCKENEF